MSEAALHDSGEPGETSLFIWLHILAAARVRRRRRGDERDKDRARTERERAVGTVTYIFCRPLFSARYSITQYCTCTCSSSHWPRIWSGRHAWVRLGLGNREKVLCMIPPPRSESEYQSQQCRASHKPKWKPSTFQGLIKVNQSFPMHLLTVNYAFCI